MIAATGTHLRRLLLGALFLLAFLLPSVTLAAPLACQRSIAAGSTTKTYLNPAGISACLEQPPPNFGWIIDSWKWSLSVVNVFAVMVLVFMAFANILYPWKTLEPYRIRQLLPNFIAGIILANVSLLIVRAITNLADILMNTPELQASLQTIWTGWGIKVSELNYGTISAVFPEQRVSYEPVTMIYQLVISVILVYLPILAFLFLSILFYVRFGVIFVLTAVAPLAFGSIIFPATKKFLNTWWDWFWKWTFGGVITYLIMFFAGQIKGPGTAAGNIEGLSIDFIPYGIALALFYAAIMAPFKLGGFIGAAVERFNRTALNKTWGATKFLGGQGWNQYGNLMGLAHKYDWANPKGSADRSSKDYKVGARLAQDWRTRSWLDPRKWVAGAGMASGRASNWNLYNWTELLKKRAGGLDRIRTEGSWESRLTPYLAGDEEAVRWWLTQDKGFYDSWSVEDTEKAINDMEQGYGLGKGFFENLKQTDPETYRLLKGTAGDRMKASRRLKVNSKDLHKSFMSKLEDFAKVTIALQKVDSGKEMMGGAGGKWPKTGLRPGGMGRAAAAAAGGPPPAGGGPTPFRGTPGGNPPPPPPPPVGPAPSGGAAAPAASAGSSSPAPAPTNFTTTDELRQTAVHRRTQTIDELQRNLAGIEPDNLHQTLAAAEANYALEGGSLKTHFKLAPSPKLIPDQEAISRSLDAFQRETDQLVERTHAAMRNRIQETVAKNDTVQVKDLKTKAALSLDFLLHDLDPSGKTTLATLKPQDLQLLQEKQKLYLKKMRRLHGALLQTETPERKVEIVQKVAPEIVQKLQINPNNVEVQTNQLFEGMEALSHELRATAAKVGQALPAQRKIEIRPAGQVDVTVKPQVTVNQTVNPTVSINQTAPPNVTTTIETNATQRADAFFTELRRELGPYAAGQSNPPTAPIV